MKRTNIYLDEEQSRLLRHLAIETDRSFSDIVREALTEYLVRRGLRGELPGDSSRDAGASSGPDADWSARMHEVLNRLHAAAPSNLTSEQIEAEITKARHEERQSVS